MALRYYGMLAVLLLFSCQLFASSVISISPVSHDTDAARNTSIVVNFDGPVDPAFAVGEHFFVFGRWSGVMMGSYTLENNNSRIVFSPARSFFTGEQVTVNISKTLMNSGGSSGNSGYCWNFMTDVDSGSMLLQEVDRIEVRRDGEGWIQTYGAYAGDLNGDGWSDYFVPNERSNDVRVFLNDQQGGYGSFVTYPLTNAARPSTNEATDFNNDGIIDVVVGNTQNNQVHVMIGDGNGGFTTTNLTAGNGVRGITILDLNGDGKMDVVTANRDGDNLSVFLGNGNGTFISSGVVEATGTDETAIVAADANNDGIQDLFVGALSSQEVILLLGDGNGGLTVSDKVSAGGTPWMITAGDVNGDGFADAVVANSSNGTAGVIIGDGNGNLTPAVTYSTGGDFPIAIDLGDIDGDGDLDMMSSSFGTGAQGSGNWRLFENSGNGTFPIFEDYEPSTSASCAVFHDRNNDGIMDVTGIDELDDLLFLFSNTLTGIGDNNDLAPDQFALGQNYPNPFNPTTRINYVLTASGNTSLELFDLAGRRVATLFSGWQNPGSYNADWAGVDAAGKEVASGIYLYRLQQGSLTISKKMMLLR
ncbi:MAG: FG-GAP-like repeat-containing protein [Calditrichia bacterium]